MRMKKFLVMAAVLSLATAALAQGGGQAGRPAARQSGPRPARTAADMAPMSLDITGQSRPIRYADHEAMIPAQPFRMAGNLYYVGTDAIGSFLIKTSAG